VPINSIGIYGIVRAHFLSDPLERLGFLRGDLQLETLADPRRSGTGAEARPAGARDRKGARAQGRSQRAGRLAREMSYHFNSTPTVPWCDCIAARNLPS